MARGSQFVVDLSVIETECENFKNCSGKYQNNTHSYFKNSYLTKCTDSQIRRAVSKISSYYENVKKDYDEIYKWWKSYIDNVNGLENYLSNQGLSTLSEQSLINYLKCSLEELETYNFDIQIAYGSFNKQMGAYNSETDKINKLNNNATSNYKNGLNGNFDTQSLNKNKNTTKQGSSFNNGKFDFNGIGTNYGNADSSLSVGEVTFNDIFGSGQQRDGSKNGSSSIAGFDIGSKIKSFFNSIEVLSDNIFNKSKKYSVQKSSIGFGATAAAFGLGAMGSRRSKKKTSSETSRYSQGNYKGSATDTNNNSSNKNSFTNNNSFKNKDSYVNAMNMQNIEMGNNSFSFSSIVNISKKIIGLIESLATNSIIICNTNGVDYQTPKADIKTTGAKIGEANSVNLINKTEYLKTNTSLGYRTVGVRVFSQGKKIVKLDNIKNRKINGKNILSKDVIGTKLNKNFKEYSVPKFNVKVSKTDDVIKIAKDIATTKAKKTVNTIFNDLNILLSKFSNKDFLEKNKHLETNETFDWAKASSEINKKYESDLELYNVTIDNQYNFYGNLTTLSETIAFKSLDNLTPQEKEEVLNALNETVTFLNMNKNKTDNEQALVINLSNLSSAITNNQFTEEYLDNVKTLLLSSLLEEKTMTSQIIYQYEIARDQLKYSYMEEMPDFDEFSDFSNFYNQCQLDENGNVIKSATISYNQDTQTITINGVTYTDYIDYNDPNTIIENGVVVKADHAYAMVDQLTLTYLYLNGLLEFPEGENNILPPEYVARNVNFMTEEEVKKYHYLYEKYGFDRAEDYFSTLEDSLNQRKGIQDALEYFNSLEGKNYAEKLVSLHLTGIGDGMLSWAEGVNNVIFANGVLSSEQYKQMWLLQILNGNVDIESFSDTDKELVKHLTEQYEKTGASLGYSYQIGSTVGNMLPTVIMSATISPLFADGTVVAGGIDTTSKIGRMIIKVPQIVSSTSIGLSTYGNTKNQALHDGYTIKSANAQAFFSALAEGGLEFALGNIPGISKESSNTIVGFIKEGGEECLQEFVGMCISMSNGEYISFDQFTETEFQTFVMSVIVSAEMNGANATLSFAGNTIVLSADKINQICSEQGVAGVEAYIREKIVTSSATDLTDANVTSTDASIDILSDINTDINIEGINKNEQYAKNLNDYNRLNNLKAEIELKLSDKYADTKYNSKDLQIQLDNINQELSNVVMKMRDNIFKNNFSISYEYACSFLTSDLAFIVDNKSELSEFFTDQELNYITQMYNLTYINPYNISFGYQQNHSKVNFNDINEFYSVELKNQNSIDLNLFNNGNNLNREQIIDLIIKIRNSVASLKSYQNQVNEYDMKQINGEKGFYETPNYNEYLSNQNKYKSLQQDTKYRKTINNAIEKFENNVVEINDEIISHNVVDIPQENETYLVHSTDFFPANKTILSNADGRKRIPFQYEVDDDIFVVKEFVSPRQTVHFTINGKVENTSKGEGNWDNSKFIVIEPYSIHKDEFVSGKIHSGDNFTNNSVKLSDNAILMVREDVYNSLTDEQKKMYNIVKYSGNANICVENLLTSKGIPVVKNYAEDKTHFMSDQFAQEEVLEKRAKAIKLIKNMELSYSNDNYYFTNEDIAMLYRNGIISLSINEDVVKKINEELNLDSENLANFIVSNGIVKVGNNSYSLLSIEELEKHFNDPDFYIESIKKSGTGLTELKSIIGNTNVDAYQNSSLLEKNHNFNDITVGQLQTLQNFNTIKHLKQQLHISKDKVLILREDGLYLSDRIEKDAYAGIMIQNYEFKNNSEVLLGSNTDTLGSIINKYNQALGNIIFYNDNFNTSKDNSNNNDLHAKIERLNELEKIEDIDVRTLFDAEHNELHDEYVKLKSYIDIQLTDEKVYLQQKLNDLINLQSNSLNPSDFDEKIVKLKEAINRIENDKNIILNLTGKSVYELAASPITEINIPSNLYNYAEQKAIEILKVAKLAEQQITVDMKSLESENTFLIGEEFKFKDQDSLSRKIISDASKNTGKDIEYLAMADVDAASKEIGDGLRYTLIINDSSYKTVFENSLNTLTEQGYEIMNVKDYWDKPHYKGINVNIETLTGFRFELQFHTPESYKTKEFLTHAFYEVKRNDLLHPDIQNLADDIQIAYQSLVETPANIDGYEWKCRKKIKGIMDLFIENNLDFISTISLQKKYYLLSKMDRMDINHYIGKIISVDQIINSNDFVTVSNLLNLFDKSQLSQVLNDNKFKDYLLSNPTIFEYLDNSTFEMVLEKMTTEEIKNNLDDIIPLLTENSDSINQKLTLKDLPDSMLEIYDSIMLEQKYNSIFEQLGMTQKLRYLYYYQNGKITNDGLNILLELYNKNKYIIKELDPIILCNDVIDIDKEFVKKLAVHDNYINNFADIYNNDKLFNKFKFIFSSMLNDNTLETYDAKIKVLLEYFSSPENSQFLINLDIENMDYNQIKILNNYILHKNSSVFHPNLNQDSNNIDVEFRNPIQYQQDFYNKCDELFYNGKISNRERCNILLLKYFDLSINEAEYILNMYNTNYKNVVKYETDSNDCSEFLTILDNIVQMNETELIECYNNMKENYTTFEEIVSSEQEIKQVYARSLNDSLSKTKNVIDEKISSGTYNSIDYNGKTVKIIDLNEDCNLLVHKWNLDSGTFYDSWNSNSLYANHGICCSFVNSSKFKIISGGNATIGFLGFDNKALRFNSCYDIYSANMDLVSTIEDDRGIQVKFAGAEDLINHTKEYNEVVIERDELREQLKDKNSYIQPDFVIINDKMEQYEIEKAYEVATQFDIPVLKIRSK